VLNNIVTKFLIDKRRDGAWARAKVRFFRFRQNTHTTFTFPVVVSVEARAHARARTRRDGRALNFDRTAARATARGVTRVVGVARPRSAKAFPGFRSRKKSARVDRFFRSSLPTSIAGSAAHGVSERRRDGPRASEALEASRRRGNAAIASMTDVVEPATTENATVERRHQRTAFADEEARAPTDSGSDSEHRDRDAPRDGDAEEDKRYAS
jgi:hypothetical protein